MTELRRRKPRDWPSYEVPAMMAITGFRDQVNRITYLPWTDVVDGFIGWEVVPDRVDRIKHGATPVLVYVMPTVEGGVFEIRCHITTAEPDPVNDLLLGKFTVPPEYLVPPDAS